MALEELLETVFSSLSIDKKNKGKKKGVKRSLPSATDFYRVGLALYQVKQKQNEALTSEVNKAYLWYLEKIPSSHLSSTFHTLNGAFGKVVTQHKKGAALDEFIKAGKSICGLYSGAPIACKAGFDMDLCQNIALAHNNLSTDKESNEETASLRESLLLTSSILLREGILMVMMQSSKDEDDDDRETLTLRRLMEAVQAMSVDDDNTYLAEMIALEKRLNSADERLPDMIRARLSESPQLDYLLLMLESPGRKQPPAAAPKQTPRQDANTSAKVGAAKVTGESEIERRIRQVHDVLPDLGDGYVEAALACFKGDVSRTVAALLDGENNPTSLPPTLQLLDKSLPARKKETSETSAYQVDDEVRQRTKEMVVSMEKQQEAEAYALTIVGRDNEYNDDYDDQYDDLDGGGDLGVGGTYDDVDLDTIRMYNRVAREAEKEQSFWEQSRNQNRRKGGTNNNNGNVGASNGDDGDGKKYRGPDKIKGGRAVDENGKVLPRQRGGKKGRQQKPAPKKEGEGGNDNNNNNNMSKQQKRRKNDNKAKIGNHNRKDRAQKKTGGAM